MNHVSLDSQSENIRDFVMTLTSDGGETVLEANGSPVAIVVPMSTNCHQDDNWSDAKNDRRCLLIDRKYRGPALTPEEAVELTRLQDQMLRFRQRIAPLPLDDARKLHQELLMKAAASRQS